MTETERKALALVNEGAARLGITALSEAYPHELANALCRAIERHEAFAQEVSDVDANTFRAALAAHGIYPRPLLGRQEMTDPQERPPQ